MMIEKFFIVINCSEEQKKKTSYATFMLDKEADHWGLMIKRIRGLLFGDSLRRHFIRSTFLIVFDDKRWESLSIWNKEI